MQIIQINCFLIALANHIPTASRMGFTACGVYGQETAVWKRHLSFGRRKHMLHHMGWGNYRVSGAVGVQDGHKQNLCERLQSEKPCAIYKFRIAPPPFFFQFKTKTEHCFLHLGPNPPNPYVNHSRGLETYCVFCFFFAFLLSFSLHIVNTKGQNTACTDRVCVVKVITGIG